MLKERIESRGVLWWNYWLQFILFSILSALCFWNFSNNLYFSTATSYFLFLLPKLQMTLLLVICFFTVGTFFVFFNHSGLTEGDSMIPLADASLHLALPQKPSFLRIRSLVISFWFLFFLESSVLGMAASCIQVFRSHMLLNFSVCTQWSCSFSLRNVASNSPAFALAALFPGLIPLAERSVVLAPYIVLSCLLCCCSCAPPQHACPQSQSSHELALDFQRLEANGQIFCFYTFMFLFLWYISPVPH